MWVNVGLNHPLLRGDHVRLVVAPTHQAATVHCFLEEDALDARASNYLTALTVVGDEAGLAWADVSTGRLHVAACAAKDVGDWLARIQPAELLCAPEQLANLPELAVEVERSMLRIPLTEAQDPRQVLELAVNNDIQVRHFMLGQTTLENAFLDLLEGHTS